MDKSLLVKIFVPTFDTGGRDGGGRVGNVGTGFPVGRDLILTARHVLEPEDRDARYRIGVRWHDYPDAGPVGGMFEIEDGDIVLPETGDLDAALLRCPRPLAARGHPGIISADLPVQGASWSSAGFPRASRRDDGRQHASFGGMVHAMSANWSSFEIDVGVPPDRDEDWRGASGMPVCAGGSSRILGIVKEVPPSFRGGRLHVVPGFRLLNDRRLRQAIGYADQNRRREDFERRLCGLLRSSPMALDTIEQRSSLLRNARLDPANRAGSAAARIMELGLEDVIRGFADAHAWLLEELEYAQDDGMLRARDVLVKAIQLIAPCLFDHGVVNGMRAQRLAGQDAAILAVPCVLATVAEIVMAGMEDRPTSFRPRENEQHYAEGTHLLPSAPESGIGGGAREREAVRESLRRKFSVGGWRELRGRVDDYLFTRFVDGPARQDARQNIERTAAELAVSARRHSYYMIYRLPEDEASRRELEDGLRELKRDYPALVVLGLTDEHEIEVRERTLFGPLRNMLPRRE